MTLLAEKPIEQIGLAEIARQASVSLEQLRGAFNAKLAILAAHTKQIDRVVLGADLSDMAEEPPRERLFDVMMRRLEALRARYPLSLHGVGLSIGGPRPLDRAHLARLAGLNRRYEPGLFSEHLAWSSHDVGFLDDLLPVRLPNHKNTFHRDPATAELTSSGRDSLITRIEENPEANVARWKKLPYLMNYQEAGVPKPGATVLAEMSAAGHTLPLLITQKYGRGRTAVFATGGDWRWQMLQPLEDMSHEMFWRQMLRWLVSDTPTRVVGSTPRPVLEDDGRVHLRAEVRDTSTAIRLAIEVPVTKIPLAPAGKPNISAIH